MYRSIALLVLTHFCLCGQAQERPIRFSVTESGVMPIVDIRDGQVVGGILYDLHQRLAAKIGRQAQMLVLPRLRVQQALLHGDVDVRCYVNPAWIDEPYHQYLWSIPFMLQRDVLVARTPTPVKPEQLQNEVIGTVLGFSYPTLYGLLHERQLRRDDARTQGQVLSKLSAGRYNYAVSNDLALHWYNRLQAHDAPLYQVHELASDLVACLVRNEADVPTMQLLRAMVRMKEDGEFEEILRRYR